MSFTSRPFNAKETHGIDLLSETARIVITTGGAFGCLVDFPEAVQADRLLAIDVPQELKYHHGAPSSVMFPLASGETVATLLEKAVVHNSTLCSVQQHLQRFPATTLDEGLGMLRSVGIAAAQIALDDPVTMQRLRTEILIPLLRRKSGRLRSAMVTYCNSVSGGTGGPAGRAFAAETSVRLQQFTSATVTVQGLQIGAITFLGLGDEMRLYRNSAVTLLEQIAYTLDLHRPPREARELVLVELPTINHRGEEIGADRHTRMHLALTLARGLAAPALQEALLRRRSNGHLVNRFGSITLVRAAWYGLCDLAPLTASAARQYATVVQQLSHQTPPPGSVMPTVQVVLTPLPAHRLPKTAEGFLSRMEQQRGRKPASLDEEVCADEPRSGTVLLAFGSQTLALDQWVQSFTHITTCAQVILDYAQLREIDQQLRSLETETQKIKAQHQRRLTPSRARLLRVVDRLLQPPFYGPITDALVGLDGKKQHFIQAFNAFHQVQRELLEAEAKLAALDVGVKLVRRTFDLLEELTSRLARMLDRVADHHATIACEWKPLDDIFPDLIRIINARDRHQLETFLATTAYAVTLPGLATLLDTEASLDGIMRRLLVSPSYDGPPWGGDAGGRTPFLTTWVFPPLEEMLREQLTQAMNQAGSAPMLVETTSISSGAAVMRLECAEVGAFAELFPSAYRLGLAEALTTEEELYPISDRARLLVPEVLGPEWPITQSNPSGLRAAV